MDSSRGRTVKSATSRSSIGESVSLVIASIRICPMMELTGPICGAVPGG
jgi:hypothetical protein